MPVELAVPLTPPVMVPALWLMPEVMTVPIPCNVLPAAGEKLPNEVRSSVAPAAFTA